MIAGKHQAAVIRRAMRSPRFLVMPANRQERRALRRMEAYGAMWPAPLLPDVWTIIPPEIRIKHSGRLTP